jgi:hypothetical protein
MPFVYSTITPSVGVPDNTAPIPLCPVNRYMRPWGTDLGVSVQGDNYSRHTVPRHLSYIPFKPAENMTFDRIGFRYYDLNSCVDTWSYKIGIYTDQDNYPKDLLADLGTLSIVPAAPPSPGAIELISLSQSLTANTLYWIAIGVNQSGGTDGGAGRTPYLGLLNGDFYQFRKRGMASGAAAVDGIAWLEQVNSFAGTFPTSTSYSNVVGSTGLAIRPQIRRSA